MRNVIGPKQRQAVGSPSHLGMPFCRWPVRKVLCKPLSSFWEFLWRRCGTVSKTVLEKRVRCVQVTSEGWTRTPLGSTGRVFVFHVFYSSEWAGMERRLDNELPSCMCLNSNWSAVGEGLWMKWAEGPSKANIQRFWSGWCGDDSAGWDWVLNQVDTKNRGRNLENKPISGYIFQGMSLFISLCLFLFLNSYWFI